MTSKAAFSGIIAVLLLVLYVGLILIGLAWPGLFNEAMGSALSLIGGLVSALVVATLAVKKDGLSNSGGGSPTAKAGARDFAVLFAPAEGEDKDFRLSAWLTSLYVLVWLVAGASAFGLGLFELTKVEAITQLGQTWLGLAVASGYAFFSLNGGPQ